MSILHNLSAMNTSRQLGITTDDKAKASEKLSSGYRINRSADDASGLAISEKMRWQIRGLDKGLGNIQNGISLCNVADGALNEVHSMLNRMEALAVQAASDVNTTADRASINAEVQQLKKEIDKIGTETTFNTMPVFLEAGKVYAGSLDNPTSDGEFFKVLGSDTSSTHYMQEPLLPGDVTSSTSTLNSGNPYVSVHIDFKNVIKTPDNQIEKLIDTSFYVNCCTNCCPNTVTFTDEIGVTRNGSQLSIGLKKADGSYYDDPEEFCKMLVDTNGSNVSYKHVRYAYKDSTLFIYDVDNNSWSPDNKKAAYFCDIPGSVIGGGSTFEGLHIQMSHRAGDALLLNIGELSTDSLKIKNDNCLTAGDSDKLIASVAEAIELLSAQRSRIGAYTNRLNSGYAVNSLTLENTQQAESLKRDTDMAKVMVAYSSYSILQQTGEAMLAQANQSKQGILSLLQ